MGIRPSGPLSADSVWRLAESSVELSLLCRVIEVTRKREKRLDADTGVRNIHALVLKLSKCISPTTQEKANEEPLPGALLDVIEEYVVPGYEQLSRQLHTLWYDVQDAVLHGLPSTEIVDTWLQQAETPEEGALAQFEAGQELSQQLFMMLRAEAAADALDSALDAAERGPRNDHEATLLAQLDEAFDSAIKEILTRNERDTP